MLAPRDRIFLKDYADLAAKNHLYAALALQQAIISPHGHVVGLESSSALHPLELSTEAQRVSEAGRLQVICQTKIFAEMVAAYEDFGALCHSIALRREQDIMRGYLQCSVRQVDGFFRRVLEAEPPTLEGLLNLPPLSDVLGVAPEDLGKMLTESYEELLLIIGGAAQHYAGLPDITYAAALGQPMEDWRERIHVFVQATPAGKGPAPTVAKHRRVFEKIKHRFLVLAQIGDYSELGTGDEIHGVAYPRTQAFLDDMLMHLDVMTQFARDLPYMLLSLDDHGLS